MSENIWSHRDDNILGSLKALQNIIHVLLVNWLLSESSFSLLELDWVSFLCLCDGGFSSTVLDLQLED